MKRFSVIKLLQRPRGSTDAGAPATAPPRRDSAEDQNSDSSPQPQAAPPPAENLQMSQTQPLPPRPKTAIASSAAVTGPLFPQQCPQESPAAPTAEDGGMVPAATESTGDLDPTSLVKGHASTTDNPHEISPDLAQVRLCRWLLGMVQTGSGRLKNPGRKHEGSTIWLLTSVRVIKIVTLQIMEAWVDTMASPDCILCVDCGMQQFLLSCVQASMQQIWWEAM